LRERTGGRNAEDLKSLATTNAPVTWVRTKLVREVTVSGLTNEGIMRQPVFLRMAEHKAAREVVRKKSGEKWVISVIL
jgi:ATP-dependent DNA ligase